MSTTRAVWLFVVVLTAIRLVLITTIELSPDEAYYWMWSERPAFSYFSKGPGVAAAIRCSTAIFGANEFGVRFWSPILAAGTSLLLFYFTRKLFSATAALWLVIAINVTPIFNIGSLVMTIDPLSVFFWSAAMLSFWGAVDRSPKFSWYWPLTGLLIGLGFLCKYTNGVELVSVLLVLALAPRLRREFARPGLYLLLAIFAACTLPPIIWNSQHAWITLSHLRSRGGLDDSPGVHPTELLAFVGEHFLVYSPLLFLGIVWTLFAYRRRLSQQFKLLYLAWFGLPLIAFYAVLSINKAAAPNWTAPALLSLGVLAVAYWHERVASRTELSKWVAAALLLGLLCSVAILNSDLLARAGVPWVRKEVSRVYGWRSAAEAVEKLRTEFEGTSGQRVFMIADERDRAAELSFYFRQKRAEGPAHPPVYMVESQDIVNQFSFWPRYDEFVEAPKGVQSEGEVYTEENGINPFVGRTALYVQSDSRTEPQRNIRSAFESVERLATIDVARHGEPLRKLHVFVCRKYRTLPL
jgi:4-amino-4-deoxy-L-arabinose transferase-like glycosyltransferase